MMTIAEAAAEISIELRLLQRARAEFRAYWRGLDAFDRRGLCHNPIALECARKAGIDPDKMNGFDQLVLAKVITSGNRR